MSWSRPFRYDNIRGHIEQQHRVKWGEYMELESDEERSEFFQLDNGQVRFANSIRAHFQAHAPGDLALVFDIPKPIVDEIVGDMMYGDVTDSEDDDELEQVDAGDAVTLAQVLNRKRAEKIRAKERALSIFKLNEEDEDGEDDNVTPVYTGDWLFFQLLFERV